MNPPEKKLKKRTSVHCSGSCIMLYFNIKDGKVQNISEDSLDSIPSPSLSVIWIFTEGEGDGIESSLRFKIFSTLCK